jgi:hypothetical protein
LITKIIAIPIMAKSPLTKLDATPTARPSPDVVVVVVAFVEFVEFPTTVAVVETVAAVTEELLVEVVVVVLLAAGDADDPVGAAAAPAGEGAGLKGAASRVIFKGVVPLFPAW